MVLDQRVAIDQIRIGTRRRPVNPAKVAELAASIAEVGLLNPISVTPDWRLIAGLHRLEACGSLGWKKVPARIVEADDLHRELAEIDENLIRADLTVLEQAEHLTRREEVLTALGQRAPAHRPEKGGMVPPLRTTEAIAAEVGLSESSAQKRKQIATSISPDVRDAIRETPIADSTTQLLRLARQAPEVQTAAVARIQEGSAKTVEEAITQVRRQELRDRPVVAVDTEAERTLGAIPLNRVSVMPAQTFLAALPEDSVDVVLTSPPYWKKRLYGGGDSELGNERTPEQYVKAIRSICQEIARVLKPTGWLFLNVGDTYASRPGQYRGDPERAQGISDKARMAAMSAQDDREWDVPDKSLCLIPWRLLLQLVLEDRWLCRNVNAWHKIGHQPANVVDRSAEAWEPVFQLTRSERPYYQREPGDADHWDIAVGRQGDGGDHPAVFPDDLVEGILKRACPVGGVVCDPFAGSGTVMKVANRLGADFVGADLIDWQ